MLWRDIDDDRYQPKPSPRSPPFRPGPPAPAHCRFPVIILTSVSSCTPVPTPPASRNGNGRPELPHRIGAEVIRWMAGPASPSARLLRLTPPPRSATATACVADQGSVRWLRPAHGPLPRDAGAGAGLALRNGCPGGSRIVAPPKECDCATGATGRCRTRRGPVRQPCDRATFSLSQVSHCRIP